MNRHANIAASCPSLRGADRRSPVVPFGGKD
jgi:hypothetical protein